MKKKTGDKLFERLILINVAACLCGMKCSPLTEGYCLKQLHSLTLFKIEWHFGEYKSATERRHLKSKQQQQRSWNILSNCGRRIRYHHLTIKISSYSLLLNVEEQKS
jgi:hypothetical protein